MEFELRPWTPDDVDSLVKFADNPKIAANLTDAFPSPYHRENAEAFIQMASKHDPIQIFAIEVNGEAAGGIGLHPQTDIHCMNIELGYWLAEGYWGKGIMTGAVKAVVDYAMTELELYRVYAEPYQANRASEKVLEKAGFTKEGVLRANVFKDGKILDQVLYSFVKSV